MLGLWICEAKNSNQEWHASSPTSAIGVGTREDSAVRAVAGADAATRKLEPSVGEIWPFLGYIGVHSGVVPAFLLQRINAAKC